MVSVSNLLDRQIPIFLINKENSSNHLYKRIKQVHFPNSKEEADIINQLWKFQVQCRRFIRFINELILLNQNFSFFLSPMN